MVLADSVALCTCVCIHTVMTGTSSCSTGTGTQPAAVPVRKHDGDNMDHHVTTAKEQGMDRPGGDCPIVEKRWVGAIFGGGGGVGSLEYYSCDIVKLPSCEREGVVLASGHSLRSLEQVMSLKCPWDF